MPLIAIAFDRKSISQSIDYQIDPIAVPFGIANRDLCPHSITSRDDFLVNFALKLRVKALILFLQSVEVWMEDVVKQFVANTLLTEVGKLDAVEQPHLITCSAGGDIEALVIALLR